MEILLWWLPPVLVTAVAMGWAGWLGRARPAGPDRSEAAQERFARAIMRDLPAEVTRRADAPRQARDRSTGIAVRPSQQLRPAEPRPDRREAPAARREDQDQRQDQDQGQDRRSA
ncbi:MAG: hypothetical protein JWR20_258 [Marmoricola sp.]|nr:hypothetical protein [Marmoricola sp.]